MLTQLRAPGAQRGAWHQVGVSFPWGGKEGTVTELRKAQVERPEEGELWPAVPRGWGTLDLVPGGHPSEPPEERRGYTRRLASRGSDENRH